MKNNKIDHCYWCGVDLDSDGTFFTCSDKCEQLWKGLLQINVEARADVEADMEYVRWQVGLRDCPIKEMM